MFEYNGRTTVGVTNSFDKEGYPTKFRLKFPIEDEDLDIPADIAGVNIIEFNTAIQAPIAEFSIYVGKIGSLIETAKSGERFNIITQRLPWRDYDDDRVVYYLDESGHKVMFSKYHDGDIVVDGVEELKNLLFKISDHYAIAQEESKEASSLRK